MDINGHIVDISQDILEATRNGMFGGPADEYLRVIPGLIRITIDGEPASLEELRALLVTAGCDDLIRQLDAL